MLQCILKCFQMEEILCGKNVNKWDELNLMIKITLKNKF
jgi:hypothetical protein